MIKTATKALHVVSSSAKELIVFSKLERIVAAISMGIPFFLILAKNEEHISAPIITIGVLIIMAIPLIVSIGAHQIKKKEKTLHGIFIFVSTLALVGFLFYIWYVILPDDIILEDSISAYVGIENAHIFGLLLTIASMLFIFNGAVYVNRVDKKSTKKHGRWYNIVLGIFLLCVVLFPCTNPKLATLHFICAIIFFFGSAVVIAVFNDRAHRKISIFIASLTVISLVLWGINSAWLHAPALNWLTLFWAETVGLWVIGIHYILESLGELT